MVIHVWIRFVVVRRISVLQFLCGKPEVSRELRSAFVNAPLCLTTDSRHGDAIAQGGDTQAHTQAEFG